MKNKESKPIGIFDSGVGGLSVLLELEKNLPNEHFIYFGDNINIPYGEKSKEELLDFSKKILDWFAQQNVKMVIMACNTSSALTLPYFKDKYSFEVLGLIEPVAKFLSQQDYSKIGMLATSATVNSNAYQSILQNYCDKNIHQIACPGLVEIVEKNNTNSDESKKLLKKYLASLLSNDVEKIILGCTHYPFITNALTEIIPEDMLVNPAVYLAKEAAQKLTGQNKNKNFKVDFYTSGSTESFVTTGEKLYPKVKTARYLNLNPIK